MKARWKWILLAAIGAVALAVGAGIAWVLWGPFSFESAAAKVKEEAALLNGRDPQRMLAEANRFYGAIICRWPRRCVSEPRPSSAQPTMLAAGYTREPP